MQIRVDQAHTRADLAYTSRSVAHTRSTSLSAVHTCGLRTKRLAGGGAAAGAGTAPERWSCAAALCGGTGARGGGTEGGAEGRRGFGWPAAPFVMDPRGDVSQELQSFLKKNKGKDKAWAVRHRGGSGKRSTAMRL